MQRSMYRLAILAFILPAFLLLAGCAKSPKETTTQLVDAMRAFDYVTLYSLVSDESKNYIPDEVAKESLAAMGYQGNVGKEHRRALLAVVMGFAQNISFTAVSQDVENDQGTVELLISFPDICRVIGKDKWIKDGEIIKESELGVLIDLAEKGANDEKLVAKAALLIGKMDMAEVKGDIYVKKEADGWKVNMPSEDKIEKWAMKWILSLGESVADCVPQDLFNEVLSGI